MENYLSEEELRLLDPKEIQKIIQTKQALSVTIHKLTPEMKQYLLQVMSAYFHEMRNDNMDEYMAYCLSELVDNGQKANIKRLFFKERNLDIFKERDYLRGMRDFMQEFQRNQQHYQRLHEERHLLVTMSLEERDGSICLEVRNNSELTVFEYKRIHDKIMRALNSPDPSAVFSQVDETEGAGLGLTISTLMFRRLGIPGQNITVLADRDETAIRIAVPKEPGEHQHLSTISREIAQMLQSIPQLPENISRINRLLSNPASQIGEIISLIQHDVTLSTDLLKMVNNAAFRSARPSTSIEEAVKMVGLRGVRNLIFAIGSIQNLSPSTRNKKTLWRHADAVGNLALSIAYRYYEADRETVSDAYVCGLLHDIGKILFEAAHPDTLRRLEELCRSKGVPPRVFEKIVAGANHAEIGALVTKKWNFPEVIIAAIRYHHNPAAAPAKYRRLVRIVYLANILTHYQRGEVAFSRIDREVLGHFSITEEQQLQALVRELMA